MLLADRGVFGESLRAVTYIDSLRLMNMNEEWAHKRVNAQSRNANFDINEAIADIEQQCQPH